MIILKLPLLKDIKSIRNEGIDNLNVEMAKERQSHLIIPRPTAELDVMQLHCRSIITILLYASGCVIGL